MNKYGQRCCPPHKNKPKKKCGNKKIGAAMLFLGIITVLALFLPMKYWVLLLSITMAVSYTHLDVYKRQAPVRNPCSQTPACIP